MVESANTAERTDAKRRGKETSKNPKSNALEGLDERASGWSEGLDEALQELERLRKASLEAFSGQRSLSSRSGSGGASAKHSMKDLEARWEKAKSVLRRLYRRTMSVEKEKQALEAKVKELEAHSNPSQVAGSSSLGKETNASGEASMKKALEQKDDRIRRLISENNRLKQRLSTLSAAMYEVQEMSFRHIQANSDARNTSAHSLGRSGDRKRAASSHSSGGTARKPVGQAASKAAGGGKKNQSGAKVQDAIALREARWNAALAERERAESDEYAERRLLEQKVAQLSHQIQERDKVDAGIETCVASLFDRLDALKSTNARLMATLSQHGLLPDDLGPENDSPRSIGSSTNLSVP